jgi:hypothetical protein
MTVSAAEKASPWLLLTFSLPTKRASQRVEVWRKLQRYGAVPLGNSGYLLPNNSSNRERFEWLATAIRKYVGEASVVTVQSIDNLSNPQLVQRFSEARAREYQELIGELNKLTSVPPHKRPEGRINRLRARFREIVKIDFFQSAARKRVEELLSRLDASPALPANSINANPRDFRGRLWVTRPRPGIDRSASAWLIRGHVDTRARFAFAPEEKVPPDAVPFDMFRAGGFGHRGSDCTFETLQKEFRIRNSRVGVIAEMIHDADLGDARFGRKEAFGIDEVLKGLAHKGLPDRKILDFGMEMIDALYHSLRS